MSDIDLNAPKIRLLVIAETLERVSKMVKPEVLFVDRGGMPTGVTTTVTEIGKVVAEMRRIAEALPEPEVRDECPICEFGRPLPVEEKDGKKISRWTCGHWIEHKGT